MARLLARTLPRDFRPPWEAACRRQTGRACFFTRRRDVATWRASLTPWRTRNAAAAIAGRAQPRTVSSGKRGWGREGRMRASPGWQGPPVGGRLGALPDGAILV